MKESILTGIPRPLPIILDTDIGDDIDDALALALILNSPELDLCGVTTVFVDAHKRACLAQELLSVWERPEILIAAGCSKPLLQPVDAQAGRQFQALDDTSDDKSTFLHGVDFLANVDDNTSTEKITLVAIGPLTNIALALARQPRLARQTRLFLMGGEGVGGDAAEWNFCCDPEAAAMVFNSGIEIWQVGYDITSQVQLNQNHLQQIAGSKTPRAQLLSRLIELWQDGENRLPFLHDPLAVLALFTNCLRFENYHAKVELCGNRRAMVRYHQSTVNECNVHVAVDVDASAAIEIFMKRILSLA